MNDRYCFEVTVLPWSKKYENGEGTYEKKVIQPSENSVMRLVFPSEFFGDLRGCDMVAVMVEGLDLG